MCATGSVLVALSVIGIGAIEPDSAAMGVSMPGPEHTLSLALPVITVSDTRTTDEDEDSAEVIEKGKASYYGKGFAGRPTANGETFDPAELTAAHPTLPFGSTIRVTNKANGKQVVVRVNDRGPFAKNRIIDLSEAAAREVGMIRSGTATVVLEQL